MSHQTISKLPYELTEIILSILFKPDPSQSLSTYLSLSLTSHSFNQIVQPQLYKNVSIYSSTASRRFFKTLESNPRLCNHLKAFYHEPILERNGNQDFDFPLSLLKVPNLEELAWMTANSMGGFMIGHHMSTMNAYRRKIDGEIEMELPNLSLKDEKHYRFYHIITPVLDDWIHRRLSEMDHLTHLIITIFPGMVLDDDKIEHVLRKIISTSNVLSIILEIGHSSIDFGSRLRRIDKSKSISKAIERILIRRNKSDQDVDIVVRTCQYGFRNGNLEEDVKFLLRSSWEEGVR